MIHSSTGLSNRSTVDFISGTCVFQKCVKSTDGLTACRRWRLFTEIWLFYSVSWEYDSFESRSFSLFVFFLALPASIVLHYASQKLRKKNSTMRGLYSTSFLAVLYSLFVPVNLLPSFVLPIAPYPFKKRTILDIFFSCNRSINQLPPNRNGMREIKSLNRVFHLT